MPAGADGTARHDESTAAPTELLRRTLPGEEPALRRFVRSLRVPGDDVDDVVQEALARAWRSRATYDPTRPLGSWLRKIAVRAWIDGRRYLAVAADQLPSQLADGRTAPAALRHDLTACLARLADVERSLLLRFHRDGHDLRQIAKDTGMPLNTVKSHLHRARRKLALGDQP